MCTQQQASLPTRHRQPPYELVAASSGLGLPWCTRFLADCRRDPLARVQACTGVYCWQPLAHGLRLLWSLHTRARERARVAVRAGTPFSQRHLTRPRPPPCARLGCPQKVLLQLCSVDASLAHCLTLSRSWQLNAREYARVAVRAWIPLS